MSAFAGDHINIDFLSQSAEQELPLPSTSIDTIVVTGCTTEGCVESTARDGMFLDYYVVVVPDCVESDTREQHEASMTLMKNRFDLVPSTDIIPVWTSAAARTATG